MYHWVTMLYNRKLTAYCKQAIMEKNKNQYIQKKKQVTNIGSDVEEMEPSCSVAENIN